LGGPRLVDQPEPYGFGTRKRQFRNPPVKMSRERTTFPLLNRDTKNNDVLRARIATNLAIKNRPEFTNTHIVWKAADLHPRIEPSSRLS
jgi:hypothetical protein